MLYKIVTKPYWSRVVKYNNHIVKKLPVDIRTERPRVSERTRA